MVPKDKRGQAHLPDLELGRIEWFKIARLAGEEEGLAPAVFIYVFMYNDSRHEIWKNLYPANTP